MPIAKYIGLKPDTIHTLRIKTKLTHQKTNAYLMNRIGIHTYRKIHRVENQRYSDLRIS